jgi:phage baseplate assembly protein W
MLGKGWSFPVNIDHLTGIISSQEEKDIRESIEIILGTSKGERIMNPDFGCGIHDYVFETMNTFTAGMIEESVREALSRWEPRIDVMDLSVVFDESDQGRLLINIGYLIRTTNRELNLVYPFYLKE